MRPASASEASRAWSSTSPRERAEVLRRAFDLVMREKEYLARLITLENGKSLADARSEVAYAAEFFRWYAEEAVRSLGATVLILFPGISCSAGAAVPQARWASRPRLAAHIISGKRITPKQAVYQNTHGRAARIASRENYST